MAAALALVAVGAVPGLAQQIPPIRHMLVQHCLPSGEYCADAMMSDATLRLPEVRCQSQPGWALQKMTMIRR